MLSRRAALLAIPALAACTTGPKCGPTNPPGPVEAWPSAAFVAEVARIAKRPRPADAAIQNVCGGHDYGLRELAEGRPLAPEQRRDWALHIGV